MAGFDNTAGAQAKAAARLLRLRRDFPGFQQREERTRTMTERTYDDGLRDGRAGRDEEIAREAEALAGKRRARRHNRQVVSFVVFYILASIWTGVHVFVRYPVVTYSDHVDRMVFSLFSGPVWPLYWSATGMSFVHARMFGANVVVCP